MKREESMASILWSSLLVTMLVTSMFVRMGLSRAGKWMLWTSRLGKTRLSALNPLKNMNSFESNEVSMKKEDEAGGLLLGAASLIPGPARDLYLRYIYIYVPNEQLPTSPNDSTISSVDMLPSPISCCLRSAI